MRVFFLSVYHVLTHQVGWDFFVTVGGIMGHPLWQDGFRCAGSPVPPRHSLAWYILAILLSLFLMYRFVYLHFYAIFSVSFMMRPFKR